MRSVLIENTQYGVSWTRWRVPITPTLSGQLQEQAQAAAAVASSVLHALAVPESQTEWSNPNYIVSTPLSLESGGGNGLSPVLVENHRRTVLIIQNNSNPGGASDVPPVLWVEFGRVPTIGQSIGLGPNTSTALRLPGGGLVLDKNCPRTAVYCLWGPYTNTSGLMTIVGVISEGAHQYRSELAPPTAGGSPLGRAQKQPISQSALEATQATAGVPASYDAQSNVSNELSLISLLGG